VTPRKSPFVVNSDFRSSPPAVETTTSTRLFPGLSATLIAALPEELRSIPGSVPTGVPPVETTTELDPAPEGGLKIGI
jgi:hypothetical protein